MERRLDVFMCHHASINLYMIQRFIQKLRFLFVSVIKLHAEKQTEFQVGV